MKLIDQREKLKAQLKDKKYRDAFVSEHIDTGIPFQIRALRKQRGWTQKELAEDVGMKQERISTIENPNYSKFTIRTLKKIASVFDVALIVRFVPLSELVEWELNLSEEKLEALSFDEDPYFKETNQKEFKIALLQPEPLIFPCNESIKSSLSGEDTPPYTSPKDEESFYAKLIINDTRQKSLAKGFFGAQMEIERPLLKLLAGGRR